MTSDQVISEFVAEVIKENPTHRSFIERAQRELTSTDEADLSEYLGYCAAQSLSVAEIADAYNTIVVDTQMEQISFMRTGSYRYNTLADACEHVYFNADYMAKYMYGLAISSFLWPNHNQMHHYFIEHLPQGGGGRYLEIGPGHGYYFMKAALLGDFDRLQGVDISPTSIAMTESVLQHYGVLATHRDRVELTLADFLSTDVGGEDCSMIVMGEVLEHVEQPGKFLERLRLLSGPDTTVYITTCINAPAIDHIYLFDTTEQVDRMINEAGFTIDDHLFVPYTGQTLEACRERRLAINVCYVLRSA